VCFFWFSLDYFVVLFAFCSVRFSFFSTVPTDWLGRTSPKWPILCGVGRKTIAQSIYSVLFNWPAVLELFQVRPNRPKNEPLESVEQVFKGWMPRLCQSVKSSWSLWSTCVPMTTTVTLEDLAYCVVSTENSMHLCLAATHMYRVDKFLPNSSWNRFLPVFCQNRLSAAIS